MPGNKTHEHQVRQFEQGDDSQDWREHDATEPRGALPQPRHEEARQTDNPSGVSRSGMHQETRGQNKHNRGGQEGHRPQEHTPDQEKH